MADAALFAPGAQILPQAELPNITLDPASVATGGAMAALSAALVGTPTATAYHAVLPSTDTSTNNAGIRGAGLDQGLGMGMGLSGLPADCQPTLLPHLDASAVAGMSGDICAFTFPPNVLSIHPCCKDLQEPMVQGNCTQFCEVPGTEGRFEHCVNGLIQTLPKGEQPKEWRVRCQVKGVDGKEDGKAVTGGKGVNAASGSYGRGFGVIGLVTVALAFVGVVGL